MRLIVVNNKIAEKYNTLKEAAARRGTRVKPDSLSQIIQSVKALK